MGKNVTSAVEGVQSVKHPLLLRKKKPISPSKLERKHMGPIWDGLVLKVGSTIYVMILVCVYIMYISTVPACVSVYHIKHKSGGRECIN